MKEISVVKRNGDIESLDIDKIHKVITWACEGIPNVSVSEIELRAKIQFMDRITTKEIHEALIKSAADLISNNTPNYSYVAAKLNVFKLRKEAYGQYEPPTLYDHCVKMVELDKYDPGLLVGYSKEEFEELNNYIDHTRDLNINYSGIKQFEGKYLIKDRVTGEFYDTPNMAFMFIAMSGFLYDDNKARRLEFVKKAYDGLSKFKISLPTPILGGLRTSTKQFSSCVKIECDDSLDSINASTSAIIKYISQRAGIGLSIGRIRSIGSKIRNGEAYHTGIVPFIKLFQAAVKSCSQGGIRGGAATLFYPIWHKEFDSLIVLKNNRGIEENRARHLDYAVQISRLFYKRLISNGNITFFSPSDVPGLYDAYFEDQDKFEKLYEQYEQDPTIDKIVKPAVEVFTSIAQERAQTGRIYIYNVDNVRNHGPFNPNKTPVRMSNLCMEITLPTKPINDVNDPDGEIALCTLGAFNVGTLETDEEYEEYGYILVRLLDNILTYQDYPLPAARNATVKRRSLGIGIINYAYWLAKNGYKYSDGSGNNATHELMEKIQYYLLKASVELAKERGPCEGFKDTRYADGLLPIDWYNKEVDTLVTVDYRKDWEQLREEIKQYGLRNSTLTALMPSETSSQVSGATNGIEPPRALVSVKASKDGILRHPVPDLESIGSNYELLWDIPNNNGYLELVAIMQKFVDQSISANTNYDPAKYPDSKVPIKEIIRDLLKSYKLGVKTLYYHNTRDGSNEEHDDEGCAGGACKI